MVIQSWLPRRYEEVEALSMEYWRPLNYKLYDEFLMNSLLPAPFSLLARLYLALRQLLGWAGRGCRKAAAVVPVQKPYMHATKPSLAAAWATGGGVGQSPAKLEQFQERVTERWIEQRLLQQTATMEEHASSWREEASRLHRVMSAEAEKTGELRWLAFASSSGQFLPALSLGGFDAAAILPLHRITTIRSLPHFSCVWYDLHIPAFLA